MLKFRFINYDHCPECNSEAVSVSFDVSYSPTPEGRQVMVHVCGERWEQIEFLCGRKDEYVPNFHSIQTKSVCQNAPAEVEKRAKKFAAEKLFIDFIYGLDVSEEDRARFFRNAGLYTEAHRVDDAAKPSIRSLP